MLSNKYCTADHCRAWREGWRMYTRTYLYVALVHSSRRHLEGPASSLLVTGCGRPLCTAYLTPASLRFIYTPDISALYTRRVSDQKMCYPIRKLTSIGYMLDSNRYLAV